MAMDKVKPHLIPTICALLAVLLFSMGMNQGAGASMLQQISPLDALNGLAFMLAFGIGAPTWLAYILASLVMIAIGAIGYTFGRRLKR